MSEPYGPVERQLEVWSEWGQASEATAHAPVTDGSPVATSEATAHAFVPEGSQKAHWLRYGHPVVRCCGALAVAERGELAVAERGAPAVAEREGLAVAERGELAVAERRLPLRDRGPPHRQATRPGRMRKPLNKAPNSSWINPPILVRQLLLGDLLANDPDLFDIGLRFPVNFPAD